MKGKGLMLLAAVMVLVWCLAGPMTVPGAEKRNLQEKTGETAEAAAETAEDLYRFSPEAFDISGIQEFLDRISGGTGTDLSFSELMTQLAQGQAEEAAAGMFRYVRDALFSEVEQNLGLMGKIAVLALIGAVFSNFSGIFGSGHVSETGFYVVYLLTMTLLAASFFASVRIADQILEDILGFMKVLLPAYFMAVAMTGGAVTSSAMCTVTFGAIGLVQMVFSEFLIPMTKVYMMMILAGNLYKEDMISRLTALLRQMILWTMKTMVGLILGFHLIQGLVLPQADALKNASLMRAVQVIPGVGAGAGAVSQILMGSGILIKNTAGAAAVLIMAFLAAVPVIKLTALMALYYGTAAVIQPVCDRRLVSCISQAAEGHGLLLRMVGYSIALFSLTIAILCISTNAAYYAG